jgi:hypothetical protein
MHERVSSYFTEYRDISSFFRGSRLVRIGVGRSHDLGACTDRATLYTKVATTVFTLFHIEFLLALCPFFLFAFDLLPSMNPDGSFPSCSHCHSIVMADWYPFSCISSNFPHCKVPYCPVCNHRHASRSWIYLPLARALPCTSIRE